MLTLISLPYQVKRRNDNWKYIVLRKSNGKVPVMSLGVMYPAVLCRRIEKYVRD